MALLVRWKLLSRKAHDLKSASSISPRHMAFHAAVRYTNPPLGRPRSRRSLPYQSLPLLYLHIHQTPCYRIMLFLMDPRQHGLSHYFSSQPYPSLTLTRLVASPLPSPASPTPTTPQAAPPSSTALSTLPTGPPSHQISHSAVMRPRVPNTTPRTPSVSFPHFSASKL